MYVSEVDRKDWDAYAERLTFALNTAQDRIRKETPFFLAHGWDARNISGTDYFIYPLVHISKLKLVRQYTDKPDTVFVVDEAERVDFDVAILPEDSWVAELEDDEYEVEKILDRRYPDPSWGDEVDLNCGGLLRDYERRQATRNRFEAMQSHEE
ncbi:unnamed protein product [Peronospora effusa]|nr:unnamed protein product [Peronospora effusa]